MEAERSAEILAKCWLPLTSGVALIVAGRMAKPSNARGERIGKFISRIVYFVYITLSLVLLVIPPLLASVASVHNQGPSTYWWPLDLTVCHFIVQDLSHKFIRLPKPLNPNYPGFRSAHASFAFGLSWLMYERYPYLAPIWFAMATIIGWARVQTQAHYTYQVVGGAAIGVLLGWAVSHRSGGVFLPRCLWPG